MAGAQQSRELRAQIQMLIRRLGVLSDDKTPCGKDLPVSDAHALQLLRQHGPLPQSALQALLGIDKSSVSRLRARLEGAGRIENRDSRDRGRPISILMLTSSGRRLAGELDEASGRRFARLWKHVPASRRSRLLATLGDLNAALARLDPARAIEPGTLERALALAQADGDLLSGRQREVLTLVAQGLTSAEIGRRLSIGQRTVETHRLQIARKLGSRGGAEPARANRPPPRPRR